MRLVFMATPDFARACLDTQKDIMGLGILC